MTVAGDYGGSDFGPGPRPAPSTLDMLDLINRCSAAERVVETVRRMDVPAMSQALIDYDATVARLTPATRTAHPITPIPEPVKHPDDKGTP